MLVLNIFPHSLATFYYILLAKHPSISVSNANYKFKYTFENHPGFFKVAAQRHLALVSFSTENNETNT